MLIGQIMIIVVLCVAFPVNTVPMKKIVMHRLYRSRDRELSTGKNLALTLTFVLWTSSLAVLFPDITSVLAVLGGLYAVTDCFLIPVMCYVRLNTPKGVAWWDGARRHVGLVAFFGTLTVIGYSSVAYTLIKAIS